MNIAFKRPRIFIATPTHLCKTYCAREFAEAVRKNALENNPQHTHLIACNSQASSMSYYQGAGDSDGSHYEQMKLDCSFYHQKDSIHKRIAATANFLREKFLQGKWDYYLSLEADVILQPSTLAKMLERMEPDQPGGTSLVNVLHSECYPGFHTSREFCVVDRLTMGCTMIRRSVLSEIPFRYDPDCLTAHYDAFFAHDCVNQKIPMHYDPGIVVEHREGEGRRGWHSLPLTERDFGSSREDSQTRSRGANFRRESQFSCSEMWYYLSS